jgi:hypothetical protein
LLILYGRGGNVASLQIFLIVSTCFLYLVAAGLFSKGVWSLEINAWNKIIGGDAAEVGSGPGSYDVRKSVWHVNVSQARRLSPSTSAAKCFIREPIQKSMVVVAGESLMPSLVGQTQLHLVQSSHTISTGSLSLPCSSPCDITKSMAIGR